VLPTKLTATGFTFDHARIEAALAAVVSAAA